MKVSIFIQDDYLIAAVRSALSDSELISLRDKLIRKVSSSEILGVVIDVTGLDVVDSFAIRMLTDISQMVKRKGTPTVVVGIKPDKAFTLVQLGLGVDGIETALDLEEGLMYLDNYLYKESLTEQ